MTATDLDKMRTIIRILCAYRGLNLAELASRLDWSRQRLNNRLAGNTPFTFDELRRMAQVLGVDPKVWFDEPENTLTYLGRKVADGDPQNWKRTDQPAVAALPAVSDDEAAVRVA